MNILMNDAYRQFFFPPEERERCMQAPKCKGFFKSPLLLADDIDEFKTTIKGGWIEESG